ncbi:MAG TPA: hypothetical protein VGB16_00270, partial [candidate division Zixibacteria bacterium]
MPRKVLISTLILLLTFGISAFGAEKKNAADQIMLERLKSMENADYPNENIVPRYITTPAPKLLGPLSSSVVGFTYYDYQHNDCMRRMIANGTDASNNIHVVWMNSPDALLEDRWVSYNSYVEGSGWSGAVTVTNAAYRGGYTGLDLLPDQREVLCYHRTQPSTGAFWASAISIETDDPGVGTFESYDIPDSVSGQPPTLKGEWPTVASAKSTVDGKNYIHITSAEGQTSGTVDKSMYYVRCYKGGSGTLICESPGWGTTLTINKDTKLAPNKLCYQFDRCRLGTGIMATSPVSEKVAIVYF